MKYKCGDKLVIKIDGVDAINFNGGHGTDFYTKQVLGKLEDFQPEEKKIKMTPDEKAEFDKLKTIHESLAWAFIDINEKYPKLFDRLYDDDAVKSNKAQLEFSRAWEKPSRIEVVKEKKYYVHLFKSQEFGYLNQIRVSLELIVSSKNETGKRKTQFTKDEIKNLKDLGFKINDDALEEVEDEND